MFKVKNRNTITRCEIDSKLTIKTPELWTYLTPCSGVSIVNFEHVNADWDIPCELINIPFDWLPFYWKHNCNFLAYPLLGSAK